MLFVDITTVAVPGVHLLFLLRRVLSPTLPSEGWGLSRMETSSWRILQGKTWVLRELYIVCCSTFWHPSDVVQDVSVYKKRSARSWGLTRRWCSCGGTTLASAGVALMAGDMLVTAEIGATQDELAIFFRQWSSSGPPLVVSWGV